MNTFWFLLNQKNKKAYVFIGLLFFITLTSCTAKHEKGAIPTNTTPFSDPLFEIVQHTYIKYLTEAEKSLDSLNASTEFTQIQGHWHNSRKAFKKAEPIMAYVHAEHYKYLNAPNILMVYEEDFQDIKVLKPTGYQVLEEAIFVENPSDLSLKAVHEHTAKTRDRLRFIRNNTDLRSYKNYHFFWLIRDAIIRVATTGITGFDSPVLAQSIVEAKWVYQSLDELLGHYQNVKTDSIELEYFNQFRKSFITSINLLGGDFDSFDRYDFIRNCTQEQLVFWKNTVDEQAISFPFTLAISNDANSLFSNSTFNKAFFFDPSRPKFTNERAELGKKLFNDKRLSVTNTMSCASCHVAELAFTDGKQLADGQLRNSPTLSYAVYQQAQFYDGRAGSLEGQIVSVVESETEFHSDLTTMAAAVAKDPAYVEAFTQWYDGQLKEETIRNAIAHYVSQQGNFSSRFDQSMNDSSTVLTPKEISGFNLFMGKASCATCHFPPLFNGTVPPAFQESEFEHLGTPENSSKINPNIDDDLGRYNLFYTQERKHFFKTPTIRNAELTAPYMHNGVYEDLNQLMDFYNVGGGFGLGIKTDYQTLPPDSLHLTEVEINDLIAFIKTLTDETD